MIITCALTLLWYCVSPPQRATQASTRHSLGTSSAQSVHRTVSASQTALLCVAVRRAFTGLRKIHQLWPAHVSLTPQMQNHPITSLAVLIPLDVQRILICCTSRSCLCEVHFVELPRLLCDSAAVITTSYLH